MIAGIVLSKYLKADLILFTAAAIWGFAFSAQRAGMEHVGPFLFTGVRFFLGAMVLFPFILFAKRKQKQGFIQTGRPKRVLLWGGALMGVLLFFGVSLQQAGLVYTTAGKAGFITGLYVILVPFFGMFRRKTTGWGTWVGAAFAVSGLYLLAVKGKFKIELGDALVLAGAFFWAAHVHVIAWLSPKHSAIMLAFIQFMVCAVICLIVAAFSEIVQFRAIAAAGVPILYGGVMSVGVAYTLQVVGQKTAHPAHAAIILSLESVFAVIGGYLILSESLSARSLAGCGLMLLGMVVSQLYANINFLQWKR